MAAEDMLDIYIGRKLVSLVSPSVSKPLPLVSRPHTQVFPNLTLDPNLALLTHFFVKINAVSKIAALT